MTPRTTFRHVKGPIRFAPEYLDLLLTGKKNTTVRLGIQIYSLGLVELTDGSRSISRDIGRLVVTSLGRLSQQDAANDGFASTDELLQALRRFYPEITPESVITVVHFD